MVRKPGRVELAHRGTLFLDEISELDPSLQSKLLQLLQDGQFCRIGAQEDKKVEVRVVCATNRNLEAEIEGGTFRQDLYYRINVVNLRMPALRERRGDIEDLSVYFLEYYNRKFNCRARPLSNEVLGCGIGCPGPPPHPGAAAKPVAASFLPPAQPTFFAPHIGHYLCRNQ